MGRIVRVAELQRRFRSVFDVVVQKRKPYILTRGGQPAAVLIPYEQYRRFIEADEAGVLRRFDAAMQQTAAANARYSEAEVQADARRATWTLRLRKRGR
jgi:prevent-host-death family protein